MIPTKVSEITSGTFENGARRIAERKYPGKLTKIAMNSPTGEHTLFPKIVKHALNAGIKIPTIPKRIPNVTTPK